MRVHQRQRTRNHNPFFFCLIREACVCLNTHNYYVTFAGTSQQSWTSNNVAGVVGWICCCIIRKTNGRIAITRMCPIVTIYTSTCTYRALVRKITMLWFNAPELFVRSFVRMYYSKCVGVYMNAELCGVALPWDLARVLARLTIHIYSRYIYVCAELYSGEHPISRSSSLFFLCAVDVVVDGDIIRFRTRHTVYHQLIRALANPALRLSISKESNGAAGCYIYFVCAPYSFCVSAIFTMLFDVVRFFAQSFSKNCPCTASEKKHAQTSYDVRTLFDVSHSKGLESVSAVSKGVTA